MSDQVVDRQLWIDALQLCGQGVLTNLQGAGADRFSRPILESFCFDQNYVWAFNGAQAVRVPLASPLNGAVQARVLLKVFSSYGGETVLLAPTPEGNSLGVRSTVGKASTNVPCLPDSEIAFHMPEEDSLSNSIPIDEHFITALKKVSVSIGREFVHPSLVGANLIINDKTSALYSTDNKSMSRYMLPDSYQSDFVRDAGVIIFPKVFVDLLIGMWDSAYTGEHVPQMQFVVRDGKPTSVVVDVEGVEAYSSLLMTDSPYMFGDIFSKHLPSRVPFTYPIPEALPGVLERALVLQYHAANKSINIRTEDRSMIVNCVGPDGSLDDTLDLTAVVPNSIDVKVDTQIFKRACSLGHNMAFLPGCFGLFDGPFTHIVSYGLN